MRNSHFYVVLVLLTFQQLNAQKIYFVRENGTGAGSSWQDASGNLPEVLQKAVFGDQIWVAKGSYFPTTTSNRSISFNIPDGISLIGGFSGIEKSKLERVFDGEKSILSGEIGTPGKEDNAYNVIYTKKSSRRTTVDGFVITGGNANGFGSVGDRARSGGGWYNDGADGASNPIIVNCIFTNNEARDGGGMFNNARNGEANPELINCQFLKNRADFDGGGMYNDGRMGGICNPVLTGCVLADNRANYGSALFNYGGGGMSCPKLTECKILKNLAYVRGGAMLNMDVGGKSLPILANCTIEENEASIGSGVQQFSAVQGSGIKHILPAENSTQQAGIRYILPTNK